MSQLIASMLFVLSMLAGGPAPTTVEIVPNNDNNIVEVSSIGSYQSLSDQKIEDGASIGIFEILCSESGPSITGSFDITTSGGKNYPPTIIEVDKCSDLTSPGGATYQVIGTTFELGFSCNSDCEVFDMTSTFEQPGLSQFKVGKIWITVTGSNPELIVVEK